MPDIPNPELVARRVALALLQGGLDHRGGFDEAMTRPPFTDLPPRERAWVRGLAATAFRRLGSIDAVLATRLKKPPPPEAIAILRIGAAQLLFRDTPAFAAVSTSVELAAETNPTRPFKGLINAVLRGLARGGLPTQPPEADLPAWLAARWSAAYGEETMAALAARLAEDPPTDLSLRDPADAAAVAATLEGEVLPGGSVRTWRRGDLPGWPGFEDGTWWVQDAAAAIPARILAPQRGETVLDVCAAPGGKTLQLAAAGAKVVALDRSAPRLRRLGENLARVGLEAEVAIADGAAWDDPRLFDAVLLDAPCTSTGTFRRHPDVIWGSRPGDIAKLAGVQARLLDASARRVRPGGRLVYCVCSLEPEEGEAQAIGFLQRHPEFRVHRLASGEGGAPPESLVDDCAWLRLLPSVAEPPGGLDGFFVVRFDRAG
ncbi:MAG TPA: transcription antitermination factor NusB [Caulobacteraceae bacterium]|jgi:16S rRNA (cytosine967-C5)-methyltransferase|nr:transcription antitermination factor NusB [Caulobacteraceae bacterium]